MISVVIPTFRRPALLNQCLCALDNQSLSKEKYEVVVVSDGPDADTAAAAAGWKKTGLPVLYRALPEKRGPAAARNTGWQQATGAVIAFTDDDCIPGQDWLLSIYTHFSHSCATACSGRTIVPVPEHPTDFERNTQGLEKADFITANCACTRAALVQVNGFDESFTMAWREDSDLEFKLLQQGIPVSRLPEAVVVHPVRQAPWGVSIKEQKKGMFNALLYKKYPGLYRQKIQPFPPFNYYAIIFSVLVCLTGMALSQPWIAAAGGIVWLAFTMKFILKRLSATSHSFKHITEMIVTSMAIPFLSVFWQLYGAYKFKTRFI